MAEIYKVDQAARKFLFEGVQGENEARSIQFDITPWTTELGNGAVTATAKRPTDAAPYPVTVTRDGNTVTWKPTSTDTAIDGAGMFQLEYTVDSVLAKTCIWSTMVAPSLDPAGDPPDPYDNWLAEMRSIEAAAIQAADDAAASAASIADDYNDILTNRTLLTGSDLTSILGSSINFEKGNVYVYDEKPTFPYSSNRIRTTGELFLHAGSVVSVSSTEVRFFLVGRNLICTSWTLNSGWISTNYTVPQDGFYYVVMSYSPESAVSDISVLKSYLNIQSTPFGGVFRSVLKDYKYDSGYIAGNGSFSSSSANGEITVSQIPVSEGETYRLYVRYKGDAFAWLAWICYKDGIGLSASNAIGSRASTSDVDISTEAYSFMHIDITVPSQAKTLAFSFRTYGEGEYVLCPYHNESYKESDIEVVYDTALKALNTSSSVDRVINEANVKSINHRGYNFVAPENTIPAFKLSKLKGFNYVETDVQFTSDGVAVLLHDPTINRTARNSDGSELSSTVNIADITYEQALTYDFGIWKSSSYAGTIIPTFEQFLLLCKNIGLSAYVEIKAGNQAQIESLADTVVQYGMKNNVSFIDFYAPRLEFVKNHNQYIRLGLLANSVDASVVSSAANLKTSTNEVFIDASVGSIDSSAVSMCISDNIPLEAWTVYANDLPLNPYVTGMTSDADVLSRKLYIMNI